MKEMNEIMRAAIFDVFERMYYVFLEPLHDEYSDYAMGSSIKFDGASHGELIILVSEGLAKTMVQNLLGIESKEITEQDIEDCVKEAANMICGSLLGKLDQTKVFDLSIPLFMRRPKGFGQGSKACSLCFDSENGRFGATLSLSE
jgi:CheY-specific phosphatase CheX